MSGLKTAFEQAVADSKSLPEKPDTPTLLKVYGLCKQARTRARPRSPTST
jgi:diazepam-binding inhibitor (GABA receptor modulator, acyl-CoA-binding protein)